MKNLKDLAKKSYFKAALYFISLLLIAMIVVMSAVTVKLNYDDGKNERDRITKAYEAKISKLDSLNTQLIKKEKLSQIKIDSLQNVKGKIIIKYEKKIENIYNAFAIEHALWLDSTINKVDSLKK